MRYRRGAKFTFLRKQPCERWSGPCQIEARPPAEGKSPVLTAAACRSMIPATTRNAVWEGGSTAQAVWAPTQARRRLWRPIREAMVAGSPIVVHRWRQHWAVATDCSYRGHHLVSTAGGGREAGAKSKKAPPSGAGLVSVIGGKWRRSWGPYRQRPVAAVHSIRRQGSAATCNAGGLQRAWRAAGGKRTRWPRR